MVTFQIAGESALRFKVVAHCGAGPRGYSPRW